MVNVLPLVFKDAQDYEKIPQGATLSTRGVTELAPGSTVYLIVNNTLEIPLQHTMSHDQIEWFKAGSALNQIAQQ